MNQPDRTLVTMLDPHLNELGFEFNKSRLVYFRKTPYGFDDFSWSSYLIGRQANVKCLSGYYEGNYGLGMRHDAVNNIWDVLDKIYGEKNKKFAFTVYRSLGDQYFPFDKRRDRELFLRLEYLEEDVTETVERIKLMLKSDGAAWYEKYASPLELSRGLNSPIATDKAHPLLNNPDRPLIAIAAACVGEPERVYELIDAYLVSEREADIRFAGKRPLRSPDFERDFKKLVVRAKELGYPV